MPEDLAPCGIETKPTEKDPKGTENKWGLPGAGGGGGETGEGTSFQMYNQQALGCNARHGNYGHDNPISRLRLLRG